MFVITLHKRKGRWDGGFNSIALTTGGRTRRDLALSMGGWSRSSLKGMTIQSECQRGLRTLSSQTPGEKGRVGALYADGNARQFNRRNNGPGIFNEVILLRKRGLRRMCCCRAVEVNRSKNWKNIHKRGDGGAKGNLLRTKRYSRGKTKIKREKERKNLT